MNEVTLTSKSLDGIRKAVAELAQRIEAPADLLPTYGRSMECARPHIEVDQRGLHFVVVERGQERERRTTNDPSELAYWIFDTVTFSMAVKFELHHRNEGEDFRRILFSKREELLAQLDSSWRSRLQAYLSQVLKRAPFDDQQSIRVQYYKQLRDDGADADKAWSLACEKYPLPDEEQNQVPEDTARKLADPQR